MKLRSYGSLNCASMPHTVSGSCLRCSIRLLESGLIQAEPQLKELLSRWKSVPREHCHSFITRKGNSIWEYIDSPENKRVWLRLTVSDCSPGLWELIYCHYSFAGEMRLLSRVAGSWSLVGDDYKKNDQQRCCCLFYWSFTYKCKNLTFRSIKKPPPKNRERSFFLGRGSVIRTHDPLVPNQMR